ncbi:MAG TPA: FecR domain-containing protein [Steroidobacteraceae bacterium]
MSAREDQVRSLIAQDAADWFVASRSGLNANERNAFATWLKASPLHVEEYLALEVIGRDLRKACEASQGAVDELLARARHDDAPGGSLWPRLVEGLRAPSPRWQTAAVAIAALGVVSLGLLVLWNLKPIAHVSTPAVTALHFETRHGEQQTHRLADNSVLHLNTDTALTVRYSDRERLVTLTSGEADFEVTHESGRPFRVFAGPAEVVDLGTRFDVRLGHQSTVVTVAEGHVAVGLSAPAEDRGANPGQAARFVQLGADQQVTVAEETWPATPVVVDAQRTTAWLHRQIVFENEPLERVVSEFNRYARKPIEITTPALRNLEVSGVFAIGNSDTFIAFLRSLEGVRVDVTATKILVSQK